MINGPGHLDTYITNRTQPNKEREKGFIHPPEIHRVYRTKGWFVDPRHLSFSLSRFDCSNSYPGLIPYLVGPKHRPSAARDAVVVSVQFFFWFKIKNLDFVFTWLSFFFGSVASEKGWSNRSLFGYGIQLERNEPRSNGQEGYLRWYRALSFLCDVIRAKFSRSNGSNIFWCVYRFISMLKHKRTKGRPLNIYWYVCWVLPLVRDRRRRSISKRVNEHFPMFKLWMGVLWKWHVLLLVYGHNTKGWNCCVSRNKYLSYDGNLTLFLFSATLSAFALCAYNGFRFGL